MHCENQTSINHQNKTTMRKDSKATKISDLVNCTTFSPLEVGVELSTDNHHLVNEEYKPLEVGVELSTDHRYLVNEMFKTFLHFSGQLARNFENGNYDCRNEFACKLSKVMIDALIKEDLYHKEYWDKLYDEELTKVND